MSTWSEFSKKSVLEMLRPGALIVDIGGGLRAVEGRGNRYDPKQAYLKPFLDACSYKILDPVPDYGPDIVGDIHALPIVDNSLDGVICIAVLEHVEDPILAMKEMLRVLKPGGKLFLYIPFLYYYHAEVGYYHDYWRYTKDSLPLLAKGYRAHDWCAVRGALETWIHLSPFGRIPGLPILARAIDQVTGKSKSNQVSGYYGFLTK